MLIKNINDWVEKQKQMMRKKNFQKIQRDKDREENHFKLRTEKF